MMKEAEANKEADEKRKESAEVKNDAEQMIFATEKSLKDLGDKVSSEDKEKAENQIKELREALNGDDIEAIKTKKDALSETAMAFATKVYEEAAKAQQENNTETAAEDKKEDKKDDAIDAEFEEK